MYGHKMETKKQEKQQDLENERVRCEIYSRSVGFIRPIENWNDGKRQEFEDRKVFKV